MAQLHRRAGFGATRAELRRDVAAGPAESVGRLLKPPEPSDEEKAVCEGLRVGAVGSSDPRRLRAYWLYRMLFGGDPLRERLTLFWHGHFATSLTKVDSVNCSVRAGRKAPAAREGRVRPTARNDDRRRGHARLARRWDQPSRKA